MRLLLATSYVYDVVGRLGAPLARERRTSDEFFPYP